MKTNFTKYITIILTVLIFASCAGQTDNGTDTGTKETNNIGHELIERVEDIPAPNITQFTDEIEQYVSVPDKVYKGTEIPISAKFIKELDFVNFGFQFDQITSKHEPNGKEWSDVLSIPDDIGIGEYEIAVTGTPKDGTGALTIYAPINIVSRPKIEVTYDQALFETEQTFTVTSETPLDIVRITDQEGTKHTLETKDNLTFKVDIVLRDASYGVLELVAYDRYGLEHEEKLYVLDPDEVRGGSLYGIGYASWNLEGKDFVVESKGSKIPLIHDEYFESLIGLPNAYIQKIEGRNYGLAISPNNEWIFYANINLVRFVSESYEEGSKYGPDAFYIENEEVIKQIKTHTFFLYNSKTGERFNLGARYQKFIVLDNKDMNLPGSTFSMRETGIWYYVLKWTDNNEVYLLEQTKEDGIFKSIQCEFYPSMDYGHFESPFATAKIVKLSLDDMTIEDTEYEPKRAWVSYADYTTGVIGYIGPEDTHLGHDHQNQLPMFNPVPEKTSWISNLEGTKQYAFADLGIPEYKDKRIDKCSLIASGYLNGKLYAVLSIKYYSTIFETNEEGVRMDPEFADEIYALEMGTGKLIKIVDFDEMYFVGQSYYSSWIDNKIYLCPISSVITGETLPKYLAYMGEDMKMHVLHEIGFDPIMKYFRRRGGNGE
jgi:hypothetical protein